MLEFEITLSCCEDLRGQIQKGIFDREDAGRDTGNLYGLLEAVEELERKTKELGGLI